MGLNQEKLQALENAKLDDLFTKNKKLWKGMAQKAYTYTRSYVSEDDDVRMDDVIKTLVPALAVTPTLQDFLATKKLRQKYWTGYFGDLILDQLWDTLKG